MVYLRCGLESEYRDASFGKNSCCSPAHRIRISSLPFVNSSFLLYLPSGPLPFPPIAYSLQALHLAYYFLVDGRDIHSEHKDRRRLPFAGIQWDVWASQAKSSAAGEGILGMVNLVPISKPRDAVTG